MLNCQFKFDIRNQVEVSGEGYGVDEVPVQVGERKKRETAKQYGELSRQSSGIVSIPIFTVQHF